MQFSGKIILLLIIILFIGIDVSAQNINLEKKITIVEKNESLEFVLYEI